jgi:uncharacterized protein YjbI with pentapeptide repeats
MDSLVEAALISAGATLVGVGGTVIVAIAGFRNSRSTNQAAINAARETSKETIEVEIANLQRALDAGREGQLADRYSRAIEQLGSDKLDVRIGGIYALERIARDSARDHPAVMEVLAAFIREHSREQWPPTRFSTYNSLGVFEQPEVPERETRPDVQAAVTVIGHRDTTFDVAQIDLRGANLSGADLRDANLSGANLRWTNLTRVFASHAKLADAQFRGADLPRVDFTGADLRGAGFTDAKLVDAFMPGAELTGAHFQKADLTGANLINAVLKGAYCRGATLTGAKLMKADFSDADLAGSNMRDADLTDANLAGADLTNADLSSAVIERTIFADSDLTHAWFPVGVIPEGWEIPAGSGKLARVSRE